MASYIQGDRVDASGDYSHGGAIFETRPSLGCSETGDNDNDNDDDNDDGPFRECTGEVVEWCRPSAPLVSSAPSSSSSSLLLSLSSSSSASLSTQQPFHPADSTSVSKDWGTRQHISKSHHDELVQLHEARAKAALMAEYYAESYLGGVPPSLAEVAGRDAREWRDLWWRRRQAPVNSCEGESTWDNLGDAAVTASLVPEINPVNCSYLSPPIPQSMTEVCSDEDCYNEEEEDFFCPATPDNNNGSHRTAADPSFQENRKRRRDEKDPFSNLPAKEDGQLQTMGPKQTRGPARVQDECRDTGDQEGLPEAWAVGIYCNGSIPDDGLVNPGRVIHLSRLIDEAKVDVIQTLNSSRGDTTCPSFLSALHNLLGLSCSSGLNACNHSAASSHCLEGTWLTMSRPNYHDCLGLNPAKEYIYTLGRMTFDMFRPSELICSVQGVFGQSRRVNRQDSLGDGFSIPMGLIQELRDGEMVLRTYNVVTAFTIEPPSNMTELPSQSGGTKGGPNNEVRRPIRGVQTTHGYILPDPRTPNRLSVWFTGGTLEPATTNDDGVGEDLEEWGRLFTSGCSKEQEGRARSLAARVLLGADLPDRMEGDGTMRCHLRQPIGGHSMSYVDVLYLDETLRVLRGHHGTVYISARVPTVPED